MRKKFSERNGYKTPREILQIESINEALKNRLWNNIKIFYIDSLSRDYPEDIWSLNKEPEKLKNYMILFLKLMKNHHSYLVL